MSRILSAEAFAEANPDAATKAVKEAATKPPPIRPLPAIEDACDLANHPPVEPRELVWGVLHQGAKMVLGGSSKSNKTWGLLDLAISISHGEPFLGFKVIRARVGFVNLEVQRPFFARRIAAIATAKNIELKPGWLDVWNLRGHCAPFDVLLPQIGVMAKERDYGLIVLDPSYKLLGGLDENRAGDIAQVMDGFEQLTVNTGAAVAFAGHFAKGNASAKESIDRISGSGVFARDPDSILTLTKHKEEDCFTLECTLRNHKPLAPFVVRWDFPLLRRDDSLSPEDLKQPKQPGRKPAYSAEHALAGITKKPTPITAWRKKVMDATGMSRSTFYSLVTELQKASAVTELPGNRWKKTNRPESPEM